MVALYRPPTGDLACNPGMCPDWESNQQLFGFQAYTQSTELKLARALLFFFFPFGYLMIVSICGLRIENRKATLYEAYSLR